MRSRGPSGSPEWALVGPLVDAQFAAEFLDCRRAQTLQRGKAQQAYGQQTAVQSGFNKKNTVLDTQAPPEQDHYGEPGMEWDPRDVSRLTRVMRGTFAFG